MEVASIGLEANTNASRAAVQQEDFLRVLLAQLQFQDPLEPLDNNEFIAQFSQLTNLEQTQQSNEKLDNLLALENANQAVNLIGKTVEAITNDSTLVGDVSAISFQNGSPVITIKTSTDDFITDISLGQISIVR
jgi:flagellar basal-body rod modification protein FlgD